MAIPFKAYDVRGIYPTELDEVLMENIGKAFANFIKGNKIAVGYDMRESSKSLSKAFIKGIISQGKTVLNFGLTSSPMSYFASCYLGANGTAMITASHNPKEYNGVKFCKNNAIPISEISGLKQIEELARTNKFKSAKEKGSIVRVNIDDAYKSHLQSLITPNKSKLKIVIDPANGMGAKDFNLIQKELSVTSKKLFFKLDGTFPNHDANPMVEGALNELKKKVLETKSNLGIAFDGDADRAFFVDEKGNQIPSDLITALISIQILKKQKGTILADLRSSNIVKEIITQNGGKAVECRVGHSFIKDDMRKTNALFAGELSGHFYFPFEINNLKTVYDSGIVTAMHMIDLLNNSAKTLSELVFDLKVYFQTGEINSKVKNKDTVLNLLEKKYSDGKISKIDGLKISYTDWWFNVRASNTEPLLRLNLEANQKELMENKKEEILCLIRK